jgi:hypothetical protein
VLPGERHYFVVRQSRELLLILKALDHHHCPPPATVNRRIDPIVTAGSNAILGIFRRPHRVSSAIDVRRLPFRLLPAPRHCPSPSSAKMWHPTKEVIHLGGDSSSNESVGSSDVEEVVLWDHSLRRSKTFTRAVLILSGRKFKSPSLEAQSKLLLLFLDKDPCDYFKARSSQAIAFKKIQDA